MSVDKYGCAPVEEGVCVQVSALKQLTYQRDGATLLHKGGTCKSNQPFHFDLLYLQKENVYSHPHTFHQQQAVHTVQALRLRDTSINSHLPRCEQGPGNL